MLRLVRLRRRNTKRLGVETRTHSVYSRRDETKDAAYTLRSSPRADSLIETAPGREGSSRRRGRRGALNPLELERGAAIDINADPNPRASHASAPRSHHSFPPICTLTKTTKTTRYTNHRVARWCTDAPFVYCTEIRGGSAPDVLCV